VTDEVRIPRDLADEMVAHCIAGRPNEACGILAAVDGEIVKVFAMTNTATSPLRYRVDDLEQQAVRDSIDDAGWELGGVFHSHTRTEAYPSPTDVREAVEDVPYVIVSLASEPPSIRAFRIDKEELWAETGDIVELSVGIMDR
jgi:[CysO sulfur-carrier protein]-S-L-cysteine hydrolase